MACDRPETAKTTGLSSISEVSWQQLPETSVNYHKLGKRHNDSASNNTQTTQKLESKQLTDVASQISPPKGLQLQNFGTATEQFREKFGNEQE